MCLSVWWAYEADRRTLWSWLFYPYVGFNDPTQITRFAWRVPLATEPSISSAPRFLDHRAGLQSGVTAPESEGYIFSPLGLEPFISNAALHLVMPRSWEDSQGISLRSSPVIWQIARRHRWNLWIYRDFVIVALLLLLVGVVVIGLSSSSLTPKVLPSVCTKLPITLARANPIRCSTLGNSHKGKRGGCLCSS